MWVLVFFLLLVASRRRRIQHQFKYYPLAFITLFLVFAVTERRIKAAGAIRPDPIRLILPFFRFHFITFIIDTFRGIVVGARRPFLSPVLSKIRSPVAIALR